MRTIYGIRSESEKLELVKGTIKELKRYFNEREFTRKEYNKIINTKKFYTLETLRNKRLIKVIRKEKFEVIINNNKIRKQCIIDKNGEIIQVKDYYIWSEQKLVESLGFKVENREFSKDVVDGIRYYYKIDFDKVEEYIERRVKYLKRDVNALLNNAKESLEILRKIELGLD